MRTFHGILFLLLFFLCAAGQLAGQDCVCQQREALEPNFFQAVNQADSLALLEVLSKIERDAGPSCTVVAHNWQAFHAMRNNKLDQARQHLEQGYAILQQNNCEGKLLAHHLRVKGEFYFTLDQLDSATVTYLRGLEIEQSIDDYTGRALSYQNLAIIFGRMRQDDKSFAYSQKALKVSERVTDQYRQAGLLGNIAMSYAYRSQLLDHDSLYLDSALQIAHQCLALARTTQNNTAQILGIRVLEAGAFFRKDHALAIAYCDSLLAKMKPKGTVYWRQIAGVYSVKCDNFKELEQLEQAELNADSAIFYAELFGNNAILRSIYERAYEVQVLKEDHEKALLLYQKVTELRDSLQQEHNQEKVNELELRYEQVQNEKTIKELSQEQEIAKLRVRLLWILLAFFLLLVPAIILYFRQRILRNRNQKLEIEQRLNRARMNPHLFFNSLAALQGFALQEHTDKRTISSYLAKYAHIMRATLESTFTELVTLEDEVAYLRQYLDIQQKLQVQPFTYQIELADELLAFETYVPGMIIQPFIENSIEHGFKAITDPAHLQIEFTKENEQLLIRLQDNGMGYATSIRTPEDYPSRATDIIRDRLFLLNQKYKTKATYQISTGSEGSGTEVQIWLPLLSADLV